MADTQHEITKDMIADEIRAVAARTGLALHRLTTIMRDEAEAYTATAMRPARDCGDASHEFTRLREAHHAVSECIAVLRRLHQPSLPVVPYRPRPGAPTTEEPQP